MIHGIYLKSRPKAKWQLVSVAITVDGANLEIEEALKQAKLEGNDAAEAAVQVFESSFWIPHYLNEIKEEQKPLLN